MSLSEHVVVQFGLALILVFCASTSTRAALANIPSSLQHGLSDIDVCKLGRAFDCFDCFV